jgi:hypothetical protein
LAPVLERVPLLRLLPWWYLKCMMVNPTSNPLFHSRMPYS